MQSRAIILAVGLVAIALAVTSPIYLHAQNAVGDQPVRWEYKLVDRGEIAPNSFLPADIERGLNRDWGEKGWELCAIDEGNSSYVFKRSKK
jgi:hypothetical protein